MTADAFIRCNYCIYQTLYYPFHFPFTSLAPSFLPSSKTASALAVARLALAAQNKLAIDLETKLKEARAERTVMAAAVVKEVGMVVVKVEVASESHHTRQEKRMSTGAPLCCGSCLTMLCLRR